MNGWRWWEGRKRVDKWQLLNTTCLRNEIENELTVLQTIIQLMSVCSRSGELWVMTLKEMDGWIWWQGRRWETMNGEKWLQGRGEYHWWQSEIWLIEARVRYGWLELMTGKKGWGNMMFVLMTGKGEDCWWQCEWWLIEERVRYGWLVLMAGKEWDDMDGSDDREGVNIIGGDLSDDCLLLRYWWLQLITGKKEWGNTNSCAYDRWGWRLFTEQCWWWWLIEERDMDGWIWWQGIGEKIWMVGSDDREGVM